MRAVRFHKNCGLFSLHVRLYGGEGGILLPPFHTSAMNTVFVDKTPVFMLAIASLNSILSYPAIYPCALHFCSTCITLNTLVHREPGMLIQMAYC